MMRSTLTFLCACLSLAVPGAGQTFVPAQVQPVVVPPPGLGTRGTWRLFHIGCIPGARPKYIQMLFRVPGAAPRQLRSIAFRRRDPPASTVATYPPITIEVEIGMSHSAQTPELFSAILPRNRGKDFRVVVLRKQVKFPAVPHRANNDYPFTYRIPLDRPFALQAGTVELVEYRLFKSNLCLGNPRYDNVMVDWYGANTNGMYPTKFGQACTGKFGRFTLAPSQVRVGNPGRAIVLQTYNGSPKSFTRVFGGLRNDVWGSLKLPYRLDRHGAPGCALYISFDWEWPLLWPTTKPFGRVCAKLDLPDDPSFAGGIAGKTIYLQAIRFDPLANALGLITSEGFKAPVNDQIKPELSMVQAPVGANFDHGQRFLGFGPVMLLGGR